MKFLKYSASAVMALAMLCACSDEPSAPEVKGNPVLNVKTDLSSAHFGDVLNFVVNCADPEYPLSTLKATLYFGEEAVAQTVIRTKDNGADYEGSLAVPFLSQIPNGNATLVFTLQNIHFAITEKEIALPVSRADYPYLTLVSADDENPAEYRMERVGEFKYELTDQLPQKMRCFIHTPVVDAQGQELVFGMGKEGIEVGGESAIAFSNPTSGVYTISFNTFSFDAAPFISFKVDGAELNGIDNDSAGTVMDLSKGQNVKVEIPDFDRWWVDPDYFERQEDGSLTFLPNGGSYMVIANKKYCYLRVYKASGDAPATMTSTGLGACWATGTGIGKPSYKENVADAEHALCLSSSATKVYDLTLTAGETINPAEFAIKLSGAMNKDVLAGSNYKVVNSDLVEVATDGTIRLKAGAALEEGKTYRLTADLTKGKRNITLTFAEYVK